MKRWSIRTPVLDDMSLSISVCGRHHLSTNSGAAARCAASLVTNVEQFRFGVRVKVSKYPGVSFSTQNDGY